MTDWNLVGVGSSTRVNVSERWLRPTVLGKGPLLLELPLSSFPVQLSLYDRTGRLVFGRELTDRRSAITLERLPAGVYFAVAAGAERTMHAKIVIE